MRHLSALMGLMLLSSCVGSEDTPSNVKDLRVLGMRLDPPEAFASACASPVPIPPSTLATPLRFTALLADPAGGGRELEYVLSACAVTENALCEEAGVELARGVTHAGQLVVDLSPGPGVARLEDGTPLVQRVLEEDAYKGLGGVRLPMLLEVRGGDELTYARKLMVYNCPFVPGMTANTQPELVGLLLESEPWGEGLARDLSGKGPFLVEAEDFSARQEAYVVPSFQLQPVQLRESWELSYYATLGSFSPNSTGGADLGGGEERHRVEWRPPSSATEPQDVLFWVVARDGRGGETWLVRSVRYTP
jgi:hypothetical protein